MPTEKLGIEIDAIAKDVANLKSMVQDLKDIQSAAGGAQIKMSDFQKQAEQTRSLRETFQSMNQVGLEMMAVSGGILYGFKKMATGVIDASVEMENYQLTLETLFKSAGKAKEELAWAKQFEVVTPYSLRDIIKSTVIFRSFGLDSRKYLGMAGDLAAAFPGKVDAFGSAVMGVAKAMASGAPGMDILNQSFGITGNELRKLGWQGKNDIEGFRYALEKFLTMRYGGAMKKVMDTLPANIEGLRSEWFKFQATVGEPLRIAALQDVRKLYQYLVEFAKTAEYKKWVKTFQDLFLGIYDAIKKTVTVAWKLLNPILKFLKTHPEFAKLAGKILFVGSALGFGFGAALHFTSQLGLAVLGVKALIGSFGGFAAVKTIFTTLFTSCAALKTSMIALYGPIGAIGALFAGWSIGKLLGELKIGKQTLNEIIQDTMAIFGGKYKQIKEQETSTSPWYYVRQAEKIRAFRVSITPDMQLKDFEKRWKEASKEFGLPMVKSAQEAYKAINKYETINLRIAERLRANVSPIKKLKSEITASGVPTPADLGITPVTDITATTRPEIDNYYYTIHFERDSVQINALDLTPEKFAKALIEFGKRQSLVP